MSMHTPNLRWVDPGFHTTVQLYCSCGGWDTAFKPANQPGQGLPLSMALAKFRKHREEEMQHSDT